MTTFARDPIVRVVVLLWLGLLALYFLPGIPADFLERLGDRYSTLPLWPWAAAACVFGISRVRDASDRRFWRLQAFSFAALLAIEIPWALARASSTPGWDAAAEWCYFAYYACQLASAVESRTGRVRAVAVCAAAAAVLSVMASMGSPLYQAGRPSYFTYFAFDIGMALVFWRRSEGATGAWRAVFYGLAVTSGIVLATDVLDWLSYEGALGLVAGMKSDILWTLPPLCYALVARFGRQRLDPAT